MKKFKYEKYDYSNIDGCRSKYDEWFYSTTIYEPMRSGGWEMTFTAPPTEMSYRPTYTSTNESKRWDTFKPRHLSNVYENWMKLREERRKASYFKKVNYFRKINAKRR